MSLPFSKTESQRIINRSQSPPQEDRLLKRARMDPKSNTEYDPTRVLFIRGLGPNVTERDIVNLCSEVGVVL